jgi:ABC-2 type transport system ATP-binding protein
MMTTEAQSAEVLDLIGLAERASEPTKKYSGGMRRRLNGASSRRR